MTVIDIRSKQTKNQDEWVMLESFSLGAITMLCFHIPAQGTYNIAMFNMLERPNEISRSVPESSWGFLTWGVEFTDYESFDKVKDLYVEDVFKSRLWWELDQ